MIGIVSDDFELLIKKNRAIYEDLSENLESLQKNCSNISSNYTGDLNFINNKFIRIIEQLDYIKKKLNAYNNTLNSIYNGYNEQSKQLITDSKKLIS